MLINYSSWVKRFMIKGEGSFTIKLVVITQRQGCGNPVFAKVAGQ